MLLTGAAQGIGLGMAQAFARAGARVIITDADREAGKEALQRLRTEKLKAAFIPCDVSAEHEVVALMTKVADDYGHLDGLTSPGRRCSFAPTRRTSLRASI